MIFNLVETNVIPDLLITQNGFYDPLNQGGVGYQRVLTANEVLYTNTLGKYHSKPIPSFTTSWAGKTVEYKSEVNSFVIDLLAVDRIRNFLANSNGVNGTENQKVSYGKKISGNFNGIELTTDLDENFYYLKLKTYTGGVLRITMDILKVPKIGDVITKYSQDLSSYLPDGADVDFYTEYIRISYQNAEFSSKQILSSSPFSYPDVISYERPEYLRTHPIVAEKSITANGVYLPSGDNVEFYGKLSVNVPDSGIVKDKTITQNGTYSPSSENADYFGNITVSVIPTSQEKTITQNGVYLPSSDNKDYYSKVTVNVVPQSAEKSVTQNGTYLPSADNVDYFSKITVNVTPSLQSKRVTPSDSSQTVTADAGYYGLSSVIVEAQQGGSVSQLSPPIYQIKGNFLEIQQKDVNALSHQLNVNGQETTFHGNIVDLKGFGEEDQNGKFFVKVKSIANSESAMLDSDYGEILEYTEIEDTDVECFTYGGKARLMSVDPATDVILPYAVLDLNNEYNKLVIINEGSFDLTEAESVDCRYVERIEDGVFMDFENLTTVILNNVEELGDSVFENSGITSIDISNVSVKGEKTFKNCTSLQSVKLPLNVSELKAEDFYGCTSLTNVVVPPNTFMLYGTDCFVGSGLTNIVIESTYATASLSIFNDTPLSRGEGYYFVPFGSMGTYLTDSTWATVSTYIKGFEDVQGGTYESVRSVNGTLKEITYYSSLADFKGSNTALNVKRRRCTLTSGRYYLDIGDTVRLRQFIMIVDPGVDEIYLSVNGGQETTYNVSGGSRITLTDVYCVDFRIKGASNTDYVMVYATDFGYEGTITTSTSDVFSGNLKKNTTVSIAGHVIS